MNPARLSARLVLLGWLFATSLSSFANPATSKLAENGRAVQSVVISDGASDAVRTRMLPMT